MIVRLSGTLIEVDKESVVVERDGVAREVLVPGYALAELASLRGQIVTFHTLELFEGNHASGHLVPRLLGFLHPEDRLFFSRFVGVKGIGHRKALRALTQPVRRVATWIEAGDAKALAQLPGIGKRAADLMVAELKGKMDDFALPTGEDANVAAVLSTSQRDAMEVLVAWGDTRIDAERWLAQAMRVQPDIDSTDEWVRLAYRVKTGVEG